MQRHNLQRRRDTQQTGAHGQRFLVTWAQNNTPVHAGFWAALQHYPAKRIVIAGRYRNPTSIWSQSAEDDASWYADEVEPYLLDERSQVCANLVCYADVRTVPTAQDPLSGFHVFCGRNSGIFGHPRRAFRTIPTSTWTPRVLATTGACTVENYTDSKAGVKGHAHHVIGALVVEVSLDGTYHLRQVTAGKDGSFTDLDTVYTPRGTRPAPPATAIALGDYHNGFEDPQVLAATREIYEVLRPRNVVLHDLLNFTARSHHARTLRDRYDRRNMKVREDVEDAVRAASRVAAWGEHDTWVVRSNHDEHFERWLDECDPHADPANAPYYFECWARAFVSQAETGEWPNMLALEAKRLGAPDNLHFVGRDDPLTLDDVAYSFHGDIGPNGSRGSSAAFARLGCKTVTGHTHSPGIWDGNYTAGVTARRQQGYNRLPSSWLNGHVAQYADGKRSLLLIINGQWRGDGQSRKGQKSCSAKLQPAKARARVAKKTTRVSSKRSSYPQTRSRQSTSSPRRTTRTSRS